METTSIGGAKYYLAFEDDFSRKVFVYFLKTKCEVFERFKEFKALVETQLNRRIKVLRTDGGGEYVNKNMKQFMSSCGIIHQITTPHTPQLNGMSERMNRTIVERAKCLLFDAKLEKKFWAEAVNTTVYLINRAPASGTGKIPEEIWTGKPVDLNHLKIFGGRAMVHIPKANRRKLDPKSKELIFVGYCENTAGYRLIDRNSGEITRSRDVIFLGDSTSIPGGTNNEYIFVDKAGCSRNTTLSETTPGTSDDPSFSHPQLNSTCIETSSVQSDPVGVPSAIIIQSDSDDDNDDFLSPSIESPSTFDDTRADPDYIPPQGTVMISVGRLDMDPVSLREALNSTEASNWQAAMQSELDSLSENNTWDFVELPNGRKAIRTKWVFKTKRNEQGDVVRFKARLVVKGCAQIPELDYSETFSPVIRYGSIRYLIALAAAHHFQIDQMDAVTAFLQGDLEEDIYISQPEGFDDSTGRVCKLNKAMYGLKQSGRQWNKKLDKAMKRRGFLRSRVDPCVYILFQDRIIVLIIAIYVDDFLILWKDSCERDKIKQSLSTEFKMKDLGPAKNCIGLRITHDDEGSYYLDQEHFINEIIERFGMTDCKPVSTPSDPSQKLSKEMSPKTDDEQKLMENVPYQKLIGALLYLVQGTRPDIAFSVGDASRYNSNFGPAHWTAAKRILRYLKGTSGLRLKYHSGSVPNLTGYSDADWAADLDKRRSCTGYVFLLQNGAISWGSRRQPTVALSTTEAEYMALSAAIQEASWLQEFANELGDLIPNKMVVISCDNQSAIHLASNDAYKARSKHIDIRHHFIREKVENSNIKLEYIPTDHMVADNLTKAVVGAKHTFCTKWMGLTKSYNN